jgi:hypothetical protein
MPILQSKREDLTPRERAEMDWEKEATRLQVEYAEKIKQMDLEVRKIEAKWTQLFKLPMAIVGLPIRFVMAFAIPISVITKKELSKEFWEFIRG